MHFSIQKIRDLIKEKKITYRELGEMIGVSDKTIQNYMLERTKIDVYTLAKLATALQVPVDYFFEQDKSDKMGITLVQSHVKADNIAIQNSGANNEFKQVIEDTKLRVEVEMLREQIEELRKEIEEKNKLINKQAEQISKLQNMVDKLLEHRH